MTINTNGESTNLLRTANGRPYAIKSAFVPIVRDKGAITSAVPLSFRHSAALDFAVSGKPGAAYCMFGAQLGGDTVFSVLLPRTNRQLSANRERKRLVLVIALYIFFIG